jgi:hypothetical protein
MEAKQNHYRMQQVDSLTLLHKVPGAYIFQENKTQCTCLIILELTHTGFYSEYIDTSHYDGTGL